ncbi:MAG TPA: FHA domain-containing protein, partial [Polyangiaceae bacterium]|nr:FHA domain-containing protein [Polyangiaceae bacterium]
MARLVDIRSGRIFELPAGANEARVFVGRSASCSVVIDVPGISRRHTCLIYRTGGLWLEGGEEQGSANGTFLNDSSPCADTPLREGDLIRLGDPTLGVTL